MRLRFSDLRMSSGGAFLCGKTIPDFKKKKPLPTAIYRLGAWSRMLLPKSPTIKPNCIPAPFNFQCSVVNFFVLTCYVFSGRVYVPFPLRHRSDPISFRFSFGFVHFHFRCCSHLTSASLVFCYFSSAFSFNFNLLLCDQTEPERWLEDAELEMSELICFLLLVLIGFHY